MLVLRILSMLLFLFQGRGLSVRVPHDPVENTVIPLLFFHVYRTEILPSFLSWNLTAGVFSFSTNVVYGLSSLPGYC